MKKFIRGIIYAAVGLAVVVIVVGFVVLNDQTVQLNFGSFNQAIEVPTLVVVCFIAGALIGMFVSLWAIVCLKREVSVLRRDQQKRGTPGGLLRMVPLR